MMTARALEKFLMPQPGAAALVFRAGDALTAEQAAFARAAGVAVCGGEPPAAADPAPVAEEAAHVGVDVLPAPVRRGRHVAARAIDE